MFSYAKNINLSASAIAEYAETVNLVPVLSGHRVRHL
jgi:hypothetical protein